MDLDWLKDFLALAEQRTFSRAADARNVTQPAFSRRIRALENWIGAPLFVRGAQGASLTPAGLHFQPAAQDLVRNLERARRETQAIDARDTVTLSIAATHALSFTFFPGWIRELMQSKVFGTLNLVSDSMEACEQIMLAGEVHFLLCHFHRDAPIRFEAERFESVRVGEDVLIPLCAPRADGGAMWSLPGSPGEPVPSLAYSHASGLGRILGACSGRELTHTDTRLHLAPCRDADDDGAGRTRDRVASPDHSDRRSHARSARARRSRTVRRPHRNPTVSLYCQPQPRGRRTLGSPQWPRLSNRRELMRDSPALRSALGTAWRSPK